MLDGKIHMQGTVEDLGKMGLLGVISQDDTIANDPDEIPSKSQTISTPSTVDGAIIEVTANSKKPRRLIEDEHREVSSVKLSIYITYLKAL